MANQSEELAELASEVRVATFRFTRRLRAESHIDEVTDTQMTVLMHLSRVGPSTPGHLAEFERVSAPSMNRTLNVLADAGFVRRVDDPSDGRRVIVELTDLGAELGSTATARRSEWLKAQIMPLAPADRAALARAAEILAGMARR